MLKCLAQLTPAELAQYLFDHREQDIELTFYAGYDEVSQEPEYAYLAKICSFAEARSLFINYMGGGNLFCYEFSGDTDASCLTGLLSTYSFHNDFTDGVWAVMPPDKLTHD